MAQSSAPGSGARRAALGFILVTAWIDVLSWGVTIPVYALLFQQFTNGDMSEAALLVGVFMTMFAAIQLFAAPVLGALSDAYGRRIVILVSCAALGLDLFAMAVAPNVWWLLVTRVIHAITAASFSAANAYVADVTTPENRARAFGYMSAAFSFGFIVGPGMGGILGQIDLRLPFLIGAALALVNAAYGYFVLPESLPKEKRTPFAWRTANPWASLTFLRSDRQLLSFAGVNLMVQLAHQLYPSIWVLYTAHRYQWDAMMVGITLALSGVASMLVSTFLVGPIVKRIGERSALVLGLCIWVATFVLEGWAPTGWIFMLGIPIDAFSGIAMPALSALMTQLAPGDRQGQLQGANSAVMSLTGLVGPALYTGAFALFAMQGQEQGLDESMFIGAPFYIGALLVLAGAAIAYRTTRVAAAAAPAE